MFVTLTRPVAIREIYTNAQGVQIQRVVNLRAGMNDLSGLDPEHLKRVTDNFVFKDALPKAADADRPDAARVVVKEEPLPGQATKPPAAVTDTHGRPVTGAQAPKSGTEPNSGDNFPRNAEGLRTDGPTVAQYADAGYLAANYPPGGFASLSTTDEIAAMIAAQDGKPGPVKSDE